MIQTIEELISIISRLLIIIKKQNEIIEQNRLVGNLTNQDMDMILKGERLIK
ncbi:MAG: hypothetical protein ACLSVX_12600 [Massilimicrobiota timonensis]